MVNVLNDAALPLTWPQSSHKYAIYSVTHITVSCGYVSARVKVANIYKFFNVHAYSVSRPHSDFIANEKCAVATILGYKTDLQHSNAVLSTYRLSTIERCTHCLQTVTVIELNQLDLKLKTSL